MIPPWYTQNGISFTENTIYLNQSGTMGRLLTFDGTQYALVFKYVPQTAFSLTALYEISVYRRTYSKLSWDLILSYSWQMNEWCRIAFDHQLFCQHLAVFHATSVSCLLTYLLPLACRPSRFCPQWRWPSLEHGICTMLWNRLSVTHFMYHGLRKKWSLDTITLYFQHSLILVNDWSVMIRECAC